MNTWPAVRLIRLLLLLVGLLLAVHAALWPDSSGFACLAGAVACGLAAHALAA